MPDAGRLDAFLADPKVPQSDKDAVASMLRGKTVQPPNPDAGTTWYGRGLDYAAGEAGKIGSAGLRIGEAMAGGLTGGSGEPTDYGQLMSDVGTVAPAVLAPGWAAAGTGVGAVSRALGGTQSEADVANTATQVLGGLSNVVRGGVEGARGVKGAIQSWYDQIAADALQRAPVRLGTDVGDALAAGLQKSDLSLAKPGPRRAALYVLTKLTNPGNAGITFDELDQALQSLKGYGNRGPIRGAIDQAMTAMLSPEGQAARKGTQAAFAQYAAKPLIRGSTGLLARAGGLYGAAQLYQAGRPRTAAGVAAASLLGGVSPGVMLGAAKGVAGPALRTAGVAAARLPSLDLRQQDVATPPESPAEPSPEPEATPSPSQALQVPPGRWGREIAAVSSLVGVPSPVIQMFMQQESGGRPGLTSHPQAGQVQTPAQGLMQITPGTFDSVAGHASALLGRPAQLGNPIDDILAGGLLLRRYLDKTGGDLLRTAAIYHGGENPAYWGPHTHQYVNDIDRRWAAASRQFSTAPPTETASDQDVGG